MNKKLIKALLKNRDARIMLYDLMWVSRTFVHGFVPGDPHASSFHEGQRSVGLAVFDLIMDVSPDAFVQMRREWLEEHKAKQEKEAD